MNGDGRNDLIILHFEGSGSVELFDLSPEAAQFSVAKMSEVLNP